jgi:hypothetical protein
MKVDFGNFRILEKNRSLVLEGRMEPLPCHVASVPSEPVIFSSRIYAFLPRYTTLLALASLQRGVSILQAPRY